MTNETKAILDWLRANDTHLRSYAPDELARLAYFCGFSLENICPNVSDRVTWLNRMRLHSESPFKMKWADLALSERDGGYEEFL